MFKRRTFSTHVTQTDTPFESREIIENYDAFNMYAGMMYSPDHHHTKMMMQTTKPPPPPPPLGSPTNLVSAASAVTAANCFSAAAASAAAASAVSVGRYSPTYRVPEPMMRDPMRRCMNTTTVSREWENCSATKKSCQSLDLL